jgi:hypothetical protein
LYQTALDNINAAWKTATEAMYAQGEQGQAAADHKLQKVTMFKRSKIILLLIFRKPFLKGTAFLL